MNKKGLAVTRGGGRGSMKCSLCGKPTKKSRGVYSYAESGLKNVILAGFPLYRCPRGHVDHVISNPAGLHWLIAAKLLAHKLDIDAVTFLRKEAGMSRLDVAGLLLLGKNENALAGTDRKGGEPPETWEDRLLRFGFLRAIEERAGCLLPGFTWRDCLNKKPRPKPLRITENDVRASSDAFACVARQEGRPGKPRLAPSRPFVKDRLPELLDAKSGRINAAKVADYLGIRLADLAKTLGVKYAAVRKTPASPALQEGLGSIKRSIEILDSAIGNRALVRVWFNGPHPELGMSTPLQTVLDGQATVVCDMLEAAQMGLPT